MRRKDQTEVLDQLHEVRQMHVAIKKALSKAVTDRERELSRKPKKQPSPSKPSANNDQSVTETTTNHHNNDNDNDSTNFAQHASEQNQAAFAVFADLLVMLRDNQAQMWHALKREERGLSSQVHDCWLQVRCFVITSPLTLPSDITTTRAARYAPRCGRTHSRNRMTRCDRNSCN